MIHPSRAGARPSGTLAMFGLALACGQSDPTDGAADPGDPDGPGRYVAPDFPAPTQACALDPGEPRTLVLTTTDFATGALSVLDLASGVLTPDVAVASSDALPIAAGDRLFVLHRFGHDYVEERDPEDFSLLAEIAISADDRGRANPHALVLAPDERAFVVLFQKPRVVIVDPSAPAADAVVGQIDLSPAAIEDGNPDASSAVACGDRMYVVAEQLDDAFTPLGQDMLLALDMRGEQLLDVDHTTPGVQGLRTLGTWLRQLRRDPSDPLSMTLLGLSTGIERIDLRRGETTWAVPASAFVAAGIGGFLQPQAFDVDAAGQRAYVAAYDADFSQVRLYVVGLDGANPQVPEPFADGFDSVERTVEIVGDALWYASTRREAPGLWRFDLRGDVPKADGPPRSTGLAPYAMVAVP